MRTEQETSDLLSILLSGKGPAYRDEVIVDYSHYSSAIADKDAGDPSGFSRRHGDISYEDQLDVMNRIITEASLDMSLTTADIGLMLAIVKIESGFNPDASAGTTSASGIAQMTNATRDFLDLSDSNMWDVDDQIEAYIDWYKQLKTKTGGDLDAIYQLHHDGPNSKLGDNGPGQKIYEEKVEPLRDYFEDYVSETVEPSDVWDILPLPTPKPEGLLPLGDSAPDNLLDMPDPEHGALDRLDDLGDDYSQFVAGNPYVGSPLVLDLDGDGIELVNIFDSKAWFDLAEDGFAHKTSWVSGGDGLLAVDLNSNGNIDDNSELFGSLTTDGFTQLDAYDTNSDGKITSADTNFSDLLIWKDADEDGETDSGELQSLSAYNITEIVVNTTPIGSPYEIEGNEITHESTFKMDGVDHDIVDAWFQYSGTLSYSTDDSALGAGIDTMPNLRGFGKVADLHRAMTDDATLETLVDDFITDHADFSNVSTMYDDFVDVLYRWAGVDGISPTSRGAYLDDARNLEFLETYLQQSFNGNDIGAADPGGSGLGSWAYQVDNAFEELAQKLLLNFVVQANSDISAVLTYNPAISAPQLNFGLDMTDLTTNEPTSSNYDKLVYWMAIAKAESVEPLLRAEVAEKIYDLQANSDTDTSRIFNLLTTTGNSASQDYNIFDDISVGTSGADANGVSANTQTSQSGDDILYMGAGNDHVTSGIGDDLLVGGTGDDILVAEKGNDIFVFNEGDGEDEIYVQDDLEPSLTDVDAIYFGEGIEISDLSFARVGVQFKDLEITIGASGDQITVMQAFNEQHVNMGGGVYQDYYTQMIEYAVLEDGTVIDLFDVMNDSTVNIIEGTSGNDTQLKGNYQLNDVLYGYDGNDYLYGYGSDDTLYGGNGGDRLYGDSGSDILYGGAGVDQLQGNSGNDVLNGGTDNDYLYGHGGNDTYYFEYGDGDDTVGEFGEGGYDIIEFGSGVNVSDMAYTKVGSYGLKISNTVSGDDILIGNFLNPASGYDYRIEEVRFADGTVIMDEELAGKPYEYVGTSGADTHTGNGYANAIYGLDGDDDLNGGYGDDWIAGGAGNDDIDGGYNTDTVSFADSAGSVNVSLASGTASGEGADTITNVENVVGSQYMDVITGDANDNVLYGGDGADTLTGGDGADTFVFDEHAAFNDVDTITDFDTSEGDMLDLGGVLFGYDPLEDALADFVEITDDGTDSSVKVDFDGKGTVYSMVEIAVLDDVTGLTDEAALLASGNIIL